MPLRRIVNLLGFDAPDPPQHCVPDRIKEPRDGSDAQQGVDNEHALDERLASQIVEVEHVLGVLQEDGLQQNAQSSLPYETDEQPVEHHVDSLLAVTYFGVHTFPAEWDPQL